jgi:hypothetical protein
MDIMILVNMGLGALLDLTCTTIMFASYIAVIAKSRGAYKKIVRFITVIAMLITNLSQVASKDKNQGRIYKKATNLTIISAIMTCVSSSFAINSFYQTVIWQCCQINLESAVSSSVLLLFNHFL